MNLLKFKNSISTRVLKCVLAATVILSCSDDDAVPNLGTLEIQLQLASGLSNIPLSDIPVKITNTTDNSESEANTDASGQIMFENIAAGTYNIIVSQSTDDYNLSGTANDIIVSRQETINEIIEINAVDPNAGLVIKEVYCVGANDGFVSLFKDQFIEIFNNSSETLFADGLYVANLFGETGTAGEDTPITDVLSTDEFVYANLIDQIPGSGQDYPIESGKSIVIALNAVNYKEGNPQADEAQDNTDATLERYSVEWLEAQGRIGNTFFDLDNPSVPNMTNIYIYEATNFYSFNSYGAGAILISGDATFSDSDIVDYTKTGSTNTFKLMRVPVDQVLDGVEILENSQAASFKRMPNAIDAGFHFVNADGGAFYSGKSSRRIKDETASARFGRVILQDTNNSSVDFESIESPDKYGYNQ
ncbi:MAG: DUF4876 domain-containing protein [Bacteroidota bacterium]